MSSHQGLGAIYLKPIFIRYFVLSCNLPVTLLCYCLPMEAANLHQISSFIIRFVMDETPSIKKTYHGTIRHIQTAEEIHFHEWSEATDFMHRFIPLDELQPRPTQEPPIS